MNAKTAGHAGTVTLKRLNTVNIDMWHHPKYYKELRKRNKSDQAISDAKATAASERATGPGLKQQASSKPQAPSSSKKEPQALKPQATSLKLQAASNKLVNLGPWKKFYGARTEGLDHDKCVGRMTCMECNLVW